MPRRLPRHLTGLIAALGLLAPAAAVTAQEANTIRIGPDLTWPLATERPSVQRATLGGLTIYEVNIRQATEEGTLDAFREQHLDRLQQMGIGALMIMPVHPIGQEKRKGELGNPYAVQDYFKVNPDYGTLEDFQELVDAAHKRGMLVVLDWVANHTAWDHVNAISDPEWWDRDFEGRFRTPKIEGLDDVIQLDLRRYSIRNHIQLALEYWVTETDVDGFRFDTADLLPMSPAKRWVATVEVRFGDRFFIADGDDEKFYIARFDTTYDQRFRDLLIGLSKQETSVKQLFAEMFSRQREAANGRFRLLYTSTSDFNSNEGSAAEVFGEAAPIMAALTYMTTGMPLIFNGQEAGNTNSLDLYNKDPIEWNNDPIADVYRGLTLLKRYNGLMSHTIGMGIVNLLDGVSSDPEVLAITRGRGENAVLFVGNFGDNAAKATIARQLRRGTYYDAISGEAVEVGDAIDFDLGPWEFRVLFNNIKPYRWEGQ